MNIRKTHAWFATTLGLVAFLTSCGGSNVRKDPVSRESKAPAASSTSEAASASVPDSSHPFVGTGLAGTPAASGSASKAPAPAAIGSLTGRVVETMNSGGYTYLLISSGGTQTWAAVNQAKVTKGDTVSVENGMMMEGFQSGTLHRKFDHILFGTLAPSGGQATSALPPGHPDASDPKFREMMANQHAAAAQGPAEVGDVRVSKAEGSNARTVAEVADGRVALKDTDVAVRGKVVKFLPGIMGKNWLHVRDGSGSADKKNNDLTVTTMDTAAIGDVVVVRGVVHIDRDFGAGYAYPVLIEDAKISK